MSGSWITPGNAMQFDDPTTAAQYYAAQGTTPQGAVSAYGDEQNPLLGMVRQAIAADPSRVYGDLLPVSAPANQNPNTGLLQQLAGLRPAVPNVLRGLVNGGLDLLESPSTGVVTPQATQAMASVAVPELGAAPEAGVLRTFGGIGARTGDTGLALTAKHLLDSGADPEDVWQKTGWYRNPYDQKMRFEMDDSGAKFTPAFHASIQANPTQAFTLKLGDMLDHQKLFDAYPDIANAEVTVAPSGLHWPQNVRGGYWPSYFDGVNQHPERFDLSGDQNSQDAMETLIHEIQHSIQTKEGFEPGGNSNLAMQAIHKLHVVQGTLKQLPPQIAQKLKDSYDENIGQSAFTRYENITGEVEANDAGSNRLYWSPEMRQAISPNGSQVFLRPNQLPLALIDKLYANQRSY